MEGLGFRVRGSGFRVSGLGFRGLGLGCRASGFRGYSLPFRGIGASRVELRAVFWRQALVCLGFGGTAACSKLSQRVQDFGFIGFRVQGFA